MDKQREDFEKWFNYRYSWKISPSMRTASSYINNPRAAGMWQAWQASRAAIVVESPAAYMGCHGDAIGPSDFDDANEMHAIAKIEKWTPLYYTPTAHDNSPEIPDGWVSCNERMPVVGECDWRTELPVLVKCEMGVIPAYYGFTYHEGEQCFGFMESVKFGDATGSGPEQHENRLMMHVTHWMPLPAPPKQEK